MCVSASSDSQVSTTLAEFVSNEGNPVLEWPDVIVLSIGLWDMLHIRDLRAYRVELQHMLRMFAQRHSNGWRSGANRSLWWVGAPTLQDWKLAPKKQPYMSNSLASSYNAAALDVLACGQSTNAGALAEQVDGVVNLQGLTSNTSAIIAETTDGIHYADATYDAVAALIVAAASV